MTRSTVPSHVAREPRLPSAGAGRLTAGAVLVTIGVLVVNAAILYAVLDRIDIGIFTVQVLVTLLLLIAAVLHFRQLARERRRYSLSTVLADLAAEPSGIEVTANEALATLVENGVADAALLALADDDSEEEMRPIAVQGYPRGWIESAQPRALPARSATTSVSQDSDRDLHPWATPVAEVLGKRPWIAHVPLSSGGNPIGLLLFVAKRHGALEDAMLLERFGVQISTALDHAAMYEASYDREQRLESLDQRRRDFIAALAHEVRTPLTSIQAFADLLQLQPGAMDETAAQLVDSLNQGVQRLNLLVNDLLDLGQSEAVGFTVRLSTVELPAVFGEIETLLRPAYLLREQTLTIEVGEGGGVVQADKDRLEQVLLNLLSNANRYTPFGGTVVLRALATDHGAIRIEVDDSGEGIPTALRERVFDPYFRVDRNDATVHGSGLGLAVARQLIELQSGRIWVGESPGGGARFNIELPLPAV